MNEASPCTFVRRYDLSLVKSIPSIELLSKRYLEKMTETTLGSKVREVSKLTEEEINKVMKEVQKERVTDLYQLSKKALVEMVKAIERQFEDIEKKAPAAGYRLFIEAGTLNPIEMYMQAYGSREKETAIKMPKLEKCPFCAKVEKENFMQKYITLASKHSVVIETGQKNPLIISTSHKASFFELSTDEKVSMIRTAYKSFLLNNPAGKNFLFHTHYGEGLQLGHQNVPHAHAHIKGALTESKI